MFHMLALNSLLDRVLCHGSLNAKLPDRKFSSGFLNWDSSGMFPVGSNADLEQHFYEVYGPYIRDEYVDEMNGMLEYIALKGNNCEAWDGWVMCSIVRMKVKTGKYHLHIGHVNTIAIETIFIRPCLNGCRILGKILQFLAMKTSSGVRICISECGSVSAAAIDKYYGGTDSEVFRRYAMHLSRHDGGFFTYVLDGTESFDVSKQKLLGYIESCSVAYPSAETLNGIKRDEIPDLEWKWNTLAFMNQKYKLGLKIVWYHFKGGLKGCRKFDPDEALQFLRDAISGLEKKEALFSSEEIGVKRWLETALSVNDESVFVDDCYTVDREEMCKYTMFVQKLKNNRFMRFFWVKCNCSERGELKQIDRRLIYEAIEILTEKKIRTRSMTLGECAEYTEFYMLDSFTQNRLSDATDKSSDGRRTVLSEVLRFNLCDMKFKWERRSYEYEFEMMPKLEPDRLEFVEIATKMLDTLAILCADK